MPKVLQTNIRANVPAIKTLNLTKVYPNGTRAVSDVSLTVQSDEFISIIGSSGAGKSSLLRCLKACWSPSLYALMARR